MANIESTLASHHRRSIRLPGYDYRQEGAYFVTLTTQNHEISFGHIHNGVMVVNSAGQIVLEKWLWLAGQYPYVQLGEFCVMPNHFHGILMIAIVGAVREPPLPDPSVSNTGLVNPEKRKPLGRLIGAFKTVSTKLINQFRGTPGEIVWQRNYYEHIIRSDREYNQISQYIFDNPANWECDREETQLWRGVRDSE